MASIVTALMRRPGPWERVAVNVAVAMAAVLVFHLLSLSSGKIDEGGGLGFDGRAYADMAANSLDQGDANTRARPLFVLPPKALHRLGVDIIPAFLIANYVYAFALALAICALLDVFTIAWRPKLAVVANIALCIAPSKSFAYYPVLIDFGALALLTWTFYLTTSGRHRAAALCGVLAATSREFALAALLYGAVSAWRAGYRPWMAAALWLPAFATLAAVRLWATSAGGPAQVSLITLSVALDNLRIWRSPLTALIFGYWVVTFLGGLSMAVLARPRWLVRALVERYELLIFLVTVLAAAIAGKVDIFRYLVFALPAMIVVFALYLRALDEPVLPQTLLVITLATIVLQRPFEQMNLDLYFRNWFPLYSESTGIADVWPARLLATAILVGTLAILPVRVSTTPHGHKANHPLAR